MVKVVAGSIAVVVVNGFVVGKSLYTKVNKENYSSSEVSIIYDYKISLSRSNFSLYMY